MKILDLRWDMEDGGMACGPMPGTCLVEGVFEDADGKRRYILSSLFMDFESLYVSETSLYDRFMDAPEELDADRLKGMCLEQYDYQIDEEFDGQEFAASPFLADIRFVRYAMEMFVSDTMEEPDEMLRTYRGKHSEELDFPMVTYGCLDDEDEEDEEDEDEEDGE